MKNTWKYIIKLIYVSIFVLTAALCGCKKEETQGYSSIEGLDTSSNAVITIAVSQETDRALNAMANNFMTKYPNVKIILKYVENYDEESARLIRENVVDAILTRGMDYSEVTLDNGETESTDDWFYDFASDEVIDLSDTTPDITDNYLKKMVDEDGNVRTYQYCLPIGGEVRGIFVNVSFLESLGLSVPENYPEFLECCQKLKDAGYVPIQGSAASAGQCIGMANAVAEIVNNPQELEQLKNVEEGVSRLFYAPLEQIYELAEKRYYDYKFVEKELDQFTSSIELNQIRCFLGLRTDEDTFQVTKPENNMGYVAFFPYNSASAQSIEFLIEKYALDTEYKFILSPFNDAGENSPGYITPSVGFVLNKNSEYLDWMREFVQFFFDEANNIAYADVAGIIPNNTDALSYMAERFSVDEEDCVLCGKILFSTDYNAYTPISAAITNTIKCGAEKYMVDLNLDSNGNAQYMLDEDGKKYLYLADEGAEEKTKIYEEYVGEEDSAHPGLAFCNLDYFLDKLEEQLVKYRGTADE